MRHTIAHQSDCIDKRVRDRDYCECGVAETQARLDQLEDERETVERLIADAEEITTGESPSLTPYVDKYVRASDLANVLAGRLR